MKNSNHFIFGKLVRITSILITANVVLGIFAPISFPTLFPPVTAQENAQSAFENGNIKLDQGDYQRAISDFTEAIRLNLNDAQVYYNRAFAYEKLGEFAKAIEDYDQAIRLKPNEDLFYFQRGVSYGKFGNHKKAIEDFNQAIRLSPNISLYYYNRSFGYKKIGNLKRANEDIQKAKSLDENAK